MESWHSSWLPKVRSKVSAPSSAPCSGGHSWLGNNASGWPPGRLQGDAGVAHLLRILLEGEAEVIGLLLLRDGIAYVFLATFVDTHEQSAFIARVRIKGKCLYPKLQDKFLASSHLFFKLFCFYVAF